MTAESVVGSSLAGPHSLPTTQLPPLHRHHLSQQHQQHQGECRICNATPNERDADLVWPSGQII